MKIFDKIREFFRKKKEIITEIDPEVLKVNESLMHLQRALAYEKGKRIRAEKELEDIEKVKGDNKREEIAKHLSQQNEELSKRDIGIPTSLKTLFKFAKKQKGKKAMHITSYNRETDFGIFRDVGLLPNGMVGIFVYGSNKPIISGKNINEIFRNCAGLKTDASKGIIAINLDSNGNYIENLENIEIPNVIVDFNNKINILNHDLKPFIERIVEKDNLINEQLSELRTKDMTLSEMHRELNEEKKNNDVLKSECNSYKSSLSDSIERMKDIQKNYNNLTKSLIILEEDNIIHEKFKEEMEKAIESLHKQLGDEKGRTTVDQAIDRMRQIVNWYSSQILDIIPKIKSPEIIITEKPEKEMPRPIKP